MRARLPIALAVATLAAMPAGGDGSAQTLTGEYTSSFQNRERPLEATFTADGEGRWRVEFHFTFDGAEHTYDGSATGSLEEGTLEGRVRTENRRRTFTFRGEFTRGRFSGTHYEVNRRGREVRTGTLTLEP